MFHLFGVEYTFRYFTLELKFELYILRKYGVALDIGSINWITLCI